MFKGTFVRVFKKKIFRLVTMDEYRAGLDSRNQICLNSFLVKYSTIQQFFDLKVFFQLHNSGKWEG